MKKPLSKYRVLFHRGHDDPGQPIPHDSRWDTKRQAELEVSRHYLTPEQRAMEAPDCDALGAALDLPVQKKVSFCAGCNSKREAMYLFVVDVGALQAGEQGQCFQCALSEVQLCHG